MARQGAGVVSRGAKTDMNAGALGFALCAAGVETQSSGRPVDPVHATAELWSPDRSDIALNKALSYARDRMARRTPRAVKPVRRLSILTNPAARAATVAARQLAVHSPYRLCLSLQAQLDQNKRLASHARTTLAGLAQSGLWWNSGIAGVKIGPPGSAQEPIEIWSDLGLVNEWAGAAAFVLGGRDLALIAASAETWRRTTAGQWAYGRAPQNWSGAEFANGFDASLWVRIHELLSTRDPVAKCRRLLTAWLGSGDELPNKLRNRLTALLASARSASAHHRRAARALEAARLLVYAGAPAAFVPALAVLVSFKQKL